MSTAVIDMSIDINTFAYTKETTCFFMVSDNTVTKLDESYIQPDISHGGVCVHFYSKKSHKLPDCFILIKQAERDKCNVDDLVIALEWCERKEIKLISLSMGTTQYIDAEKLWLVTQRLYKKGLIIVSSASNDQNVTYPACFCTCIGVCVDYSGLLMQGSFSYQDYSLDGIQVILSSYTAEGELLGSNSMATAYFTGMLAAALHENNDLKDWLRGLSVAFPQRNMYEYAIKRIKPSYEEDVVKIAISDMQNKNIKNYYSKLQNIFIQTGYYCIIVFSMLDESACTEMHNYAFSYQKLHNFTYAEYIDFIVKFCCPNIVILDSGSYNPDEIDVFLHNTEPHIKHDSMLSINMQRSTPFEAYELIKDYFDSGDDMGVAHAC